MTIRSGRFLPLFTVLLACGPTGGERGELGNDRFFYACVDDADAICDDVDLEAEPLSGIPRIALGARFGIETEGRTTTARAVNDRLDEDPHGGREKAFTALEPGWTTVMSVNDYGDAVDLVHVSVAETAALELSQREPTAEGWSQLGTGPLAIEKDHQMRVVPLDAEGAVLAGGLPMQWTAEPEGIVEFLPEKGNNVVTVRPVASGLVTVSVEVNEILTASADFDVSYGDGGGGAGGGGGDVGGGGGNVEGGGGAGGGQQ